MLFGRIFRHVFVMSSFMIAVIAIVLAFSGRLDGPNAHFDLRGGAAARAESPACQGTAPSALARHIVQSEGEPAGKP